MLKIVVLDASWPYVPVYIGKLNVWMLCLLFFKEIALRERENFIGPPVQANTYADVLWKLRKMVYGLCDASHNWYFSIAKELLSMNCVQSKIDKAIFIWYDNTLAGLIVLYVDVFLYAVHPSRHLLSLKYSI